MINENELTLCRCEEVTEPRHLYRHSEDVCPKNLVHNNKILRFAQDDEVAERQQSPCHPELPEAGQNSVGCTTFPCHPEFISGSCSSDNEKILTRPANGGSGVQNDKNFSCEPVCVAVQHDKKRVAFTLAEVLITLGIIGVVAAVTIPTLTKAYQKKIIEAQIKKAYSEIRQGFALAEAENDIMSTWPTGADMNVANYTDTYIKPYFKSVKICANMPECGYKESNWDFSAFRRQWSGSNWGLGTDDTRVLFKLNDGVVVFMPRNTTNAQGLPSYVNHFFIDVNGPQKPNTLNKDVFKIRRGTAGGITPIETLKTIMDNGWKLPANFNW